MLDNSITRTEIQRLVKHFYNAVRRDPVLAPVFAQSVQPDDWPAHEEKITRFWANAILHERDYSGNPMQAHRDQGHVHTDHFPIWLDLFEHSARQVLPAPKAEAFTRLARRIGASLQMGLERPSSSVPNLR